MASNELNSLSAIVRAPWLWVRLALIAITALIGYAIEPPDTPEPLVFYIGPMSAVLAPTLLSAPLAAAFFAARRNREPQTPWDTPDWLSNPFRASGPHHRTALMGLILVAAGVGALISTSGDIHEPGDMMSYNKVFFGGFLFCLGTYLRLGVVFARRIYAIHCDPKEYARTTTAKVPAWVDRTAAGIYLFGFVALLSLLLVLLLVSRFYF